MAPSFIVLKKSEKMKIKYAGFSLVESLVTLVIFSTTMLMIMGLALRQIQLARENIRLSQLHMQEESLVLLALQGERCESKVE